MNKRVDVACALIFDQASENVLMVKNKKGDSYYWSLPGGAVEVGETIEAAVIRETKEEAGLYSVREAHFSERGDHALIFTFLAKIIDGEMKVSDPDEEILEVKWIDIKTANEFMPYLTDELKISPDRSHKMAHYYFHGEV
ncbi:NUDIX hydrolase [Paenibacillus dendritiformis]|uniref:NUDIX hydrolase n=1 Tax=Paenibacillus dendritiformis TaxID=130049 RepID=UPI00364F8530